MSSVKCWGIDSISGKLINIHELSLKDKKNIICTDSNCKCNLIPNLGTKKDWYFRHPAGSPCTGGSSESIIHSLAKEIISEFKSIDLPSSIFRFKEENKVVDLCKSYSIKSIDIERSLTPQLRPDLIIETESEEIICIEVFVTHRVSSEKLSKYIKYFKESDKNFFIVEIDLSSIKDNIDSLNHNDISNLIKNKMIILSSKGLMELNDLLNAGIYQDLNSFHICPIDDNSIMSTKSCKRCPFFSSYRNNVLTCYGKSCYTKLSDFANSKEENYDIYCHLLPKIDGKIVKDNEKVFDDSKSILHPFGVCECCGKPLSLYRGDMTYRVSGIPILEFYNGKSIDSYNDLVRNGIFLKCNSCKRTKQLLCNKCNNPLGIWVNSNRRYKSFGSVFIGCLKRDNIGGNCTSDTLTIYKDENCVEYADELKTVETLDNWLNSNKVAMKNLFNLRYKGDINE